MIFQPLGKHHRRAAFSCGHAGLDDWFRHRASQDAKRNVARVFVAVDDVLGVVGFYSLSSFTLTVDDMPAELARTLPRYDSIPAALIGRLARDLRVRGRGVGERLLTDAIEHVASASKSVAMFAIVVDAKDIHAAAFYEGFGFRRFANRPSRLFLPTATIAAAQDRMT